MAAAAGHAYPSDEDEHTVSMGPIGFDAKPDQHQTSCHHHQPFNSDTALAVKTPERRPAVGGGARSLPRDSMSEQRRRVFRGLNDATGNLSPRCAESSTAAAAPSTPQPYRSRSYGSTAGDADTPQRLAMTRSAPQPLRARARTYSHSVGISEERAEDACDGGTVNAAFRSSAPDWADLARTPPRRTRARTLSYDTPPRPGEAVVCSESSPDVEQGTPLRRTTSCDDEALQGASPPLPRRSTLRVGAQETVSVPLTQRCSRWTFSYGRRARAVVSVGLYLVLMTLDRAGIMNKLEQPHRQYESDFGKEIQFNGIGMAIDNDQMMAGEDKDTGGDPAAGQVPARTMATPGEKKTKKAQRAGGKKKRRPVVAQARSLGLESRPVFVPKVEQHVEHHAQGLVGDEEDPRGHAKGVHKIQTFSLSEEDLKAPLPEDLLPPDYEAGPSTLFKILTLSAWVCLTILVMDTGFREIQRRFQYVNLRQLRAHSEDRSR